MELVKHLDLQSHPEGGYYKETYRSDFSTGIYYLLSQGQKSRLHRIKSDEMWHFYSGDPLIVVELSEDGSVKETFLGENLDKGERFQYVVPAGVWFGAYLAKGSQYALVGCTVSPAFRFEDFEMGDMQALISDYPRAIEVIQRLLS